MFIVGDVAAIMSEVQRRVRLAILAVGISQFADEVCPISAFGPSFAQTAARGTAGAAKLSS